jgi:hypothetical protein
MIALMALYPIQIEGMGGPMDGVKTHIHTERNRHNLKQKRKGRKWRTSKNKAEPEEKI